MNRQNKRIELRLESTKDKTMSGWQLQEFIASISKCYTKLDLLNEVAYLINNGVNPENIAVINNSYDINNNYKYLQNSNEIDLGSASLVEKLYNLGRPFSLYPNEKILKIRLIFELYEKLYTLFNSKKIARIPKHNLKDYIDLEFDEMINQVRLDCDSIIQQELTNCVQNQKKRIEILKEDVENYISDINRKYKKFVEDREDIEEFKELSKLELGQIPEEKKDMFIRVEKAYYSDFFKCFRTVDRPIIIVYNDDTNKLSILKVEYMINDSNSENFLDYKDYSHNSPFTITLIGGVAIYAIIKLIYEGIKDEGEAEKMEEENGQLVLKISNVIDETIMEATKSDTLNQVDEIKDKFLKNKFADTKYRVNKATRSVLKDKGVINNKIVININDYKKENKCTNNPDNNGATK